MVLCFSTLLLIVWKAFCFSYPKSKVLSWSWRTLKAGPPCSTARAQATSRWSSSCWITTPMPMSSEGRHSSWTYCYTPFRQRFSFISLSSTGSQGLGSLPWWRLLLLDMKSLSRTCLTMWVGYGPQICSLRVKDTATAHLRMGDALLTQR